MLGLERAGGPADVEFDLWQQWVAAWRAAVRASSSAVALVQLPSTRFLELSGPAGELLGVTPADALGMEYLAVVERPHEPALTAWLLTARVAEAVQARRRLRRADGSVIEVSASGRAVRSSRGGDMALWMVGDVVAPAGWAGSERAVAMARPSIGGADLQRQPAPVVLLDGDWRVAGLDSAVDDALGHRASELMETTFTQLVNPDDIAFLLLALARATSGVNATVTLRLRHGDGTWRPVAVTPTAMDDRGVPRFSLVLRAHDAPPSSPASSPGNVGASMLRHHLGRIAIELEAAATALTAAEAADVRGAPALLDLSARQQEIATRLMRGERVPRIAEAMYLSQSTVRNHLAAIFRKFGVHSQEELLAELRGAPPIDLPARH